MIELKITFDPSNGQIAMSGPLQDKILCLGLLEMGKNTVLTQTPKTTLLVPQLQMIPKNGDHA